MLKHGLSVTQLLVPKIVALDKMKGMAPTAVTKAQALNLLHVPPTGQGHKYDSVRNVVKQWARELNQQVTDYHLVVRAAVCEEKRLLRAMTVQSSVDTYSLVLTRLLLYCVRLAEEPALPDYAYMHSTLLAAVKSLMEQLAQEPLNMELVRPRLIEFVMAFVKHRSTAPAHQNLLYRFFIMMMVERGSSGSLLKTPRESTKIGAALFWCFQVVVGAVITADARQREADQVMSGEEQVEAMQASIKSLVSAFGFSSFSPLGDISRTYGYLKACASHETIVRVTWKDDLTARLQSGRVKRDVNLVNVQEGLAQRLNDLGVILYSELLLGVQIGSAPGQLPDLDLNEMDRDWVCKDVGWTMFSSGAKVDREQLLGLVQTPALSSAFGQLFRSSPGSPLPELNKRAALDYLAQCATFNELACFLAHVLGGLPPRSTSQLAVQFANTPHRHRGVFVHGDMIMFVYEYDKAQAITGVPRRFPRFLPPALSRLLVLYWAYVRPLE